MNSTPTFVASSWTLRRPRQSVLVEAQGEMLDNIENQVGKSVEYVHKGHASLVQARKYQKSSRWWMCCSLIIVTIIAMAVILPVVKPWSA